MSQDLIIHRFNKISNDELQVNHLNPVDEAMIADASCRLVAGESFEISNQNYCVWLNDNIRDFTC